MTEPLLTWSDRFSVDNNEIDEQHRKIIEIINVLHAARLQNKDAQHIEKVLSELMSYTRYHFEAEEKLFAAWNFPELAEHRREHAEFSAWLANAHGKLASPVASQKEKRDVAVATMNFLKTWLTSHILNNDKKNAYYLRKNPNS